MVSLSMLQQMETAAVVVVVVVNPNDCAKEMGHFLWQFGSGPPPSLSEEHQNSKQKRILLSNTGFLPHTFRANNKDFILRPLYVLLFFHIFIRSNLQSCNLRLFESRECA